VRRATKYAMMPCVQTYACFVFGARRFRKFVYTPHLPDLITLDKYQPNRRKLVQKHASWVV